jgi:beta-mannanase
MYETHAPWSFSSISSLETSIDRHDAIVHWYQSWGQPAVNARDFDVSLLEATRQHGSTPFITWEPWDMTSSRAQQTYPLSSIAAGAFDSYIDSWAKGMKDYGHPVLLAFAQEMQESNYPWGFGVNGNTAAQYIAAYRHVHDRFKQAGAANVQWVWTPDQDDSGSSRPPLTDFYPGDAYVDWLSVDVYNFGTTESWSTEEPLTSLLQLSYSRLTSLSASKPIMLAEWASVEQGGSKVNWITQASSAIPQVFPRIGAVVWFNEDNTEWALQSSSTSLAAADQAFSGPPYCATLPY